MRRFLFSFCALGWLALGVGHAQEITMSFTEDAPTDFALGSNGLTDDNTEVLTDNETTNGNTNGSDPFAWNLDELYISYDRITQCLYLGATIDDKGTGNGVDFADPNTASNADNLGSGFLKGPEFFTGGLDLDNDGAYDLYFGLDESTPETGSEQTNFQVSGWGGTAGAGPSGASADNTKTGYDSTDDFSSIVSMVTDSEGQENSFEFKLDLASAPTSITSLIPDPYTQTTTFGVRIDTGNGSDNQGEDELFGFATFPPIPEPSSVVLMLTGMCLALLRRKR